MEHVISGGGIIDWREFFRVLIQREYNGHPGIDSSQSFTLKQGLIDCLDCIRGLLLKTGFELEH